MKKFRNVLVAGMMLAMALSIGAGFNVTVKADLNSQQYEGVKLNKYNFPDGNVRKVLKKMDDNHDGFISIMEQKNQEEGAELYLNIKKGTVNLKGISKLKAIESINIEGSNKKIKIKNFSEINQCKELKELYLSNVKAGNVSIINNKKLKSVNIVSSKIKQLTVSDNKKLKEFKSDLNTDKLKFGKNLKLTNVDISGKTKAVDITKLTNLTSLSVKGKELKKINLTKNKKIKNLWIINTNLSSLNLKNNKQLTFVVIRDNKKIRNIDFSKNTKLDCLSVDSNSLEKLNLKNNKKLTILDCSNNKLEKLDLSNLTNLESLDCSENQLLTLDLEKQVKLWDLNCSQNKLTKLDVTKLKELSHLTAGNNEIAQIDLSNCPKLYSAELNHTKLSTIDLSKNINLDYLNIEGTSIKELDVTNNNKMIRTDESGKYAGYGVSCDVDVVIKANNEVVKAYKVNGN